MLKNNNKSLLCCAISLALLSGCGGSSSDSEQSSPSPNATNSIPTISSTSFEISEDNTLSNQITAADIDGDALSFTIVNEPTNGTLSLAIDGNFIYTPTENYFGSDDFVIKANDGKADSANTTINITILGVNDSPVLAQGVSTTRQDQPIILTLNATDIDSDELTYQISQQPKSGIASLEGNQLTYTPNAGVEGEDTLQISVSDGIDTTTSIITIDNNLAYQGNVVADDLSGIEIMLTTEKGDLLVTSPNSDGSFKFYGVDEDNFAIKIRKAGYRSSPAKSINLATPQAQASNGSLLASPSGKPVITQGSGLDKLSNTVPHNSIEDTQNDEDTSFELTRLEGDNFIYHWQEDQTTAGSDYAAAINQPIQVEFLDEMVTIIDDASADKLRQDYHILLVDSENQKWSQEHAYRILETMKKIPQELNNPDNAQSLAASKWTLTSDFIENDIQITEANGQKTVLISAAAFTNATPRVAQIEGKRGVYFSQKLHHALVRFVTDNGSNVVAYEKILNDRYGVTTQINDYSALTSSTTFEPSGRFQPFQAEEVVQIINMFEETPSGFHSLPELQVLARRLNGTPHPLYPDAPAVAWTDSGYIEFMESAFTSSSVEHMHRLIIHEKAHFLWAHQFDQQLREDWIELGGWSQDGDGNWATTKQTEFVSAYAHAHNPNEDMAESISFFIVNPDALRSRALAKYEFVRDRIMQGNIYLSTIRDDLTFQVYNLFPDYVFPGKIKQVDIEEIGAADEDKTVNIELNLHALDTDLEGAKEAYTRIHSEIGTFVDLRLYPVDENGEPLPDDQVGTKLTGSFTLSKRAKAGFWRPRQIQITDAVGNQRLEGANDFGWKLYVNNSEEDTLAPQYVANTATIAKSETTLEQQSVQLLHASWQVDENAEMATEQACYASLNDEHPDTYRVEAYGNFDIASRRCNVEFVMPHYMPSSTYSMNFVRMEDSALNTQGVYFTEPGFSLRDEETVIDEQPQQIPLVTDDQDLDSPELDLNNITIQATPVNIDAPNGETIVEVTFRVRDNNSGYNIASLILRDPQGTDHQYWAYNDDTYTLFPTSDPTQYQAFTRTIVLPRGSAPGTWGISEMTVYDRAGNFQHNDFTEIVHFDVED